MSASTSQSHSRALHSILIGIEQAYSFLLEIEDIDALLQQSANGKINVQKLQQKRSEMIVDFFKHLNVFVPTNLSLSNAAEDGSFA